MENPYAGQRVRYVGPDTLHYPHRVFTAVVLEPYVPPDRMTVSFDDCTLGSRGNWTGRMALFEAAEPDEESMDA